MNGHTYPVLIYAYLSQQEKSLQLKNTQVVKFGNNRNYGGHTLYTGQVPLYAATVYELRVAEIPAKENDDLLTFNNPNNQAHTCI